MRPHEYELDQTVQEDFDQNGMESSRFDYEETLPILRKICLTDHDLDEEGTHQNNITDASEECNTMQVLKTVDLARSKDKMPESCPRVDLFQLSEKEMSIEQC